MKRFVRYLDTVIKGIDQVSSKLMWVATFAIMAMTLLTTMDVLAMNIWNRPVPGVKELVEEGMVWTVFMAIVYVQLRMGHLKVDLVSAHVGRRARIALQNLGYLMGLVAFGLIAWRSIFLVKRTLEAGSYKQGLINLPLLPSHIVVGVGVFLLSLVLLIQLIRGLATPIVGLGEDSQTRPAE